MAHLWRPGATRKQEPAPPAPVSVLTPGARTGSTAVPGKKDRPTPTRREAEAARRQRVTRTLTKREARLESSRQARSSRMRVINAREGTPEKSLMRDYVDARFSIGELLLPSLAVIFGATILSGPFPRLTVVVTMVMYLFLLLVVLDGFLLWRGFKRVLAERLPNAPTRGLAFYGVNRALQIRRFRMPAPRLKRGESF